jgi:predicted dithiol-disulfide oxidoreductase (DUF899 family)
MTLPKIVEQDQWLAARKELLAKEKEFTRQRDALSEARRTLPMVKVEKQYKFDGPHGAVTLKDLFEGRQQLIVYHFMLDPSWDEGCKGCSYILDNITGGIVHLSARDTAFAAISRAPLSKIEAFKKRMGWTVPWFSSFGNDFNYDFQVTSDEAVRPVEYNYMTKAQLQKKGQDHHTNGENPGLSVFLRDGDSIFHTYSTYSRGLDIFLSAYHLLDATPLGRNEEPGQGMKSWLRHHDKYALATSDNCHCSE